jgi:hypothetical protein
MILRKIYALYHTEEKIEILWDRIISNPGVAIQKHRLVRSFLYTGATSCQTWLHLINQYSLMVMDGVMVIAA